MSTLLPLLLLLSTLLTPLLATPVYPLPYQVTDRGPSENLTALASEQYSQGHQPLWPEDRDPFYIAAHNVSTAEHSPPVNVLEHLFEYAWDYKNVADLNNVQISRPGYGKNPPLRCVLHDELGDPEMVGPLGIERYAIARDCMYIYKVLLPQMMTGEPDGLGIGRHLEVKNGTCIGVGFVPEPWAEEWDEGGRGIGWEPEEGIQGFGQGATDIIRYGGCRVRGYSTVDYWKNRGRQSVNCFTGEEIEIALRNLFNCAIYNLYPNQEGEPKRIGGRVYTADDRGAYKVLVVTQ